LRGSAASSFFESQVTAVSHVIRGLWSESLSIFLRIDKAGDHAARVVRLIQHSDPVEIESVRLASQVAKVFHHCISLMVVPGRYLGAPAICRSTAARVGVELFTGDHIAREIKLRARLGCGSVES